MAKDKNARAVELIGSPERLINQVIKDTGNRELALHAITQEGPPHKQIQHTLVLNRLAKLVSLNKKATGVALKYTKGLPIMSGAEDETPLPFSIPKKSLAALTDPEEVMEKLSKGPKHEAMYTALLLQVIEAMIAAQESKTL